MASGYGGCDRTALLLSPDTTAVQTSNSLVNPAVQQEDVPVPNDIPRPVTRLEDEPWFRGVLTKDEAEQILEDDGDFLVRKCNKDQNLYLSVYQSEPYHFLLSQEQMENNTLGSGIFAYIQQFINHHVKDKKDVDIVLRRAKERNEPLRYGKRSLKEKSWFLGNVTWNQAERLLTKEGDFFVREIRNETDSEYVLSVFNDRPRHVLIESSQHIQWFHGVISRDDAENQLNKEGDFLVRKIPVIYNPTEYLHVLSFFWQKRRHIIIQYRYTLGNSRFRSIVDVFDERYCFPLAETLLKLDRAEGEPGTLEVEPSILEVKPGGCFKDLKSYPWFYGQISKEKAEELLSRNYFLVREIPEDKGQYILSIKVTDIGAGGVDDDCYFHLFLERYEKKYHLGKQKFDSIPDLVERGIHEIEIEEEELPLVVPKKIGCMSCRDKKQLTSFHRDILQPGDNIEIKGNTPIFGYFYRHHAIVSEVNNISEDGQTAEVWVIDVPTKKTRFFDENELLIQKHQLCDRTNINCREVTRVDYRYRKHSHAITLKRANTYANIDIKERYCLCCRNCEHFTKACVSGEGNRNDEDINSCTCDQSVACFWRVIQFLVALFQGLFYTFNFFVLAVYVAKDNMFNVFDTRISDWVRDNCFHPERNNITSLHYFETDCDWKGMGVMTGITFLLYMSLFFRQYFFFYKKNFTCIQCLISVLLLYMFQVVFFVVVEIVNIMFERTLYNAIHGIQLNVVWTTISIMVMALLETILVFKVAAVCTVGCLFCLGKSCCRKVCCTTCKIEENSYQYINVIT